MDIVVGHAKGPDGTFSTCVWSLDYNAAIESKRKFTSMTGDEIQIMAVFLGKGSKAQEIHASLQEHIRCKFIGVYDASPGQITDTVHHILAPASLANTFTRSVDQLIAPVESKSNVPASNAESAELSQPNGGKKPRIRVRK